MITLTWLQIGFLSLVILNSILIVKAWNDHKHITGLEMWIDAFMDEQFADPNDAD